MTTKQYNKAQFLQEYKAPIQLQDRALANNLDIVFYLEEPINIEVNPYSKQLEVYDYQGIKLGTLLEGDRKQWK